MGRRYFRLNLGRWQRPERHEKQLDRYAGTGLMSTDTDNDSLPVSQTPRNDTNDYSFRMNQAMQMFGNPAVLAAIQDAADSHGVELR